MADSTGPVPIGDLLRKLATNATLTEEARAAIRAGLDGGVLHHPACPCLSCHRFYRTVP